MSSGARNLTVFAACLLGFAMVAPAQVSGIEGTVKGSDGSPVAGALIQIERKDIAGHYSVKSDRTGHFGHYGLPLGRYKLTLVIGDQAVDQRDDVRTRLGDPLNISFNLKERGQQTGQSAKESPGRPLSPEQRSALEDANRKRELLIARNRELSDAFSSGVNALRTNQYKLAVSSFERASELDATHGIIWVNLAESLAGLARTSTGSEHDQALEQSAAAYEKAVAVDPNNAAFHSNYGMALVRIKKVDQAVTQITKAVEIDAANAGRYNYNLGAVLVVAGRQDEALSAFKASSEAGFTEAYYQYGIGLLGKATITARGINPVPGTVEALQRYVQLARGGHFAQEACKILGMVWRMTPDAACRNVQSGPAPLPASVEPQNASDSGNIREEIDRVFLSGKFSAMPPIMPTGAPALPNGNAELEIENATSYPLTLLFSGPVDRRVKVDPGRSFSLELPPGSYKCAGRVNAEPFYGEDAVKAMGYLKTFYIEQIQQ